MKNSILVFIGLFLTQFTAQAACPPLMILDRTTNRNRVWYTTNPADALNPVAAKWEMIEKGPGKWEDLTAMEKRRAYGIRMSSTAKGSFSIVSVLSVAFQLKTDSKTGCQLATYKPASGPEMNMKFVHLKMKGSVIPSVEKVEFVGTSLVDGREIRTEIKL